MRTKKNNVQTNFVQVIEKTSISMYKKAYFNSMIYVEATKDKGRALTMSQQNCENPYQRWSPRGRPWPRERPRGHILKSLALASKFKSLAFLSSARGQHYFGTVEISLENARNIAKNFRTPFLSSSLGA